MEASAASADRPPRARAVLRIGAVVAALILTFLAAVAVIAMLDITDLTPCDDVGTDIFKLNDKGECFDGSSTKKAVTLAFGWPGAVLACLSVLLMLAFAIRGRGIRTAVLTIAAAAALFGLGVLIGSV
ncbi:MAG: hypothetical protein H0V25_12430 [Solirubrobacterales bacterium]|nr:hypothetical protein [Solirubrobacterales bacterium]